jgi:hypothetical protein
MKAKQIVVRADWMKACGYPEEDVTMDVTFTYPRTLPDGTRMFDVVRPDGRPWTVAEWRCAKVIE